MVTWLSSPVLPPPLGNSSTWLHQHSSLDINPWDSSSQLAVSPGCCQCHQVELPHISVSRGQVWGQTRKTSTRARFTYSCHSYFLILCIGKQASCNPLGCHWMPTENTWIKMRPGDLKKDNTIISKDWFWKLLHCVLKYSKGTQICGWKSSDKGFSITTKTNKDQPTLLYHTCTLSPQHNMEWDTCTMQRECWETIIYNQPFANN